jgi:hypothetical protein
LPLIWKLRNAQKLYLPSFKIYQTLALDMFGYSEYFCTITTLNYVHFRNFQNSIEFWPNRPMPLYSLFPSLANRPKGEGNLPASPCPLSIACAL